MTSQGLSHTDLRVEETEQDRYVWKVGVSFHLPMQKPS